MKLTFELYTRAFRLLKLNAGARHFKLTFLVCLLKLLVDSASVTLGRPGNLNLNRQFATELQFEVLEFNLNIMIMNLLLHLGLQVVHLLLTCI